ncbi:NADH-quinone oxidoreductase subunit C [Sphingomonas canadensis]|uniref:NADH-quinone oxidoreductase subunit C n=1 Tax=Sphingomonas canadensis TaxID=1219257 RepID=A0ABW3H9D9_9SPHN|nr:NADH-quinone oxidoreductase subunit C [Sphingomonas canadensis]MCW3836811.1 NADH-quinone oxidoreductase subunit C [Sphingomonas canadensis]
MKSPAPKFASNEGMIDAIGAALGDMVVHAYEGAFEVTVTLDRERLVEAMIALRDTKGLEYQQLMEIAGVDYPEREERFEVVYCLLSLTRNHRIKVKVLTDEVKPVPSVTGIWPVAGWLEREVYDMYGVLFEGNADLRRILTDYGFTGHPQRKDFPLTGYVELRYSEEEKRVVYSPVELAQDFRNFDFMSPWEGAQYILPGDEKAGDPPAPPPGDKKETSPPPAATTPKTSDSTADTGAGKPGPDAGPEPKKGRAKK